MRHVAIDRRGRRVQFSGLSRTPFPFLKMPRAFFPTDVSLRILDGDEASALTTPPPDAVVFYHDPDHAERTVDTSIYRQQEYQPGGAW